MKKRDWLYLSLISICMIVFFGYRLIDQLRTDTVPPEITISTEELVLSVQDTKTTILQNVSATDDHDGDVSDSLVVESIKLANSDGSVTITYAAFDKAGNVAKKVQKATYSDYQSPVFSLNAPLAFPVNSGYDILDIIQAWDALDGNISHRIRASSLDNASVATAGIHEVEFRVSNSLGDTVEMVFPVEVYASDLYNATLTLTDYLVYLPYGTSFNAANYLDSFTYGASTTFLGNGIPDGYTLDLSGTVDTQVPGVYSVTYTLTSGAKNGYSKLIVVVEG